MKFHYYPDTDSLYIDLSERTAADSREVAPGVVLDFDDEGRLVGIDIDHASQVLGQEEGRMVFEIAPALVGATPTT